MNIVKLLFLLVIPIFDPDFLEFGLDRKSPDLTTSLEFPGFLLGAPGDTTNKEAPACPRAQVLPAMLEVGVPRVPGRVPGFPPVRGAQGRFLPAIRPCQRYSASARAGVLILSIFLSYDFN